MSFREEKKALSREKRVSTVSNYSGTLETLTQDVQGSGLRQRVRTFSQSYRDEIIAAIQILGGIDHSVIIVYGAAGCSASALGFHETYENMYWYSTDLKERDTILGGDEKLREAVKRAYEEHRPQAIFIVGTPVVAINNDDVTSVIMELEEELSVRIVHVQTDGFQSKTPLTGCDLVLHALLRHVVKPPAVREELGNAEGSGQGDYAEDTEANSENDTGVNSEEDTGADFAKDRGGRSGGVVPEAKREDFINVISLTENIYDVIEIAEILTALSVPYRILPQFSSIDSIREAAHARASIVLDPDEGGYFAQQLEEAYGVPYIRTEIPVGLRGTAQFIRKVAKELGIEERAEQYIAAKEEELEEYLDSGLLAGKSVFLDIAPYEAAGFTALIKRLGGETAAIAVSNVDLNNRRLLEHLDQVRTITPIMVANGQEFEKANILAKNRIDIYLSTKGDVAFAGSRGAQPVSLRESVHCGYSGIKELVNVLKNTRAAAAPFEDEPDTYDIYLPGWLKKSSGWYVKQEVS